MSLGKMEMVNLDLLSTPMHVSPLSINTKCEILQRLWSYDIQPSMYYDENNHLDFDVYFDYYTEQCSIALHDGGRHISLRTHRDIIDVAGHIRDGTGRERIKNILSSKLSTPKTANENEVFDAAIDLTASLLFMVDLGKIRYGFTSFRSQVLWTEDSAEAAIHIHFEKLQVRGVRRNDKLYNMFNARNVSKIAGIQIIWTKNLADHLRLTDDDDKVLIFYHATFLACIHESPHFPPGLIDETLQTLALLFPQYDKETRRWFKKIASSRSLDKKIVHCGFLKTDQRNIENFVFWRDRLAHLKQVFDDTEPRTLAQGWRDTRNKWQWYTFWVAVALTIVSGLIQSIEGALQVYKAFYL